MSVFMRFILPALLHPANPPAKGAAEAVVTAAIVKHKGVASAAVAGAGVAAAVAIVKHRQV